MENPTHYPLLAFVLAFFVLWRATWFGVSVRNRGQEPGEDMRQDFSIILAATLTLLGLIIGFTFSMASSRYDQRKLLEEEEANAIGTEFVRADLLPAADAVKVRTLLTSYLDQRILFYQTNSESELQEINARTAKLQTQLWQSILPAAAAQPTPIVALAVAGMNDVLNSQGYTQAAVWNRIPTSAWALMSAIAIACNVLFGYASHANKGKGKLLIILPLVVATAFMLIADIDSPRHGLIRVTPQNLLSLADSIRPQ